MDLLRRIVDRAKGAGLSLYEREPARVHGAIVAGVLAVAGALGVVVSAPAVLAVVAVLAPIVVAELTRPKVVSVAKVEAAEDAGVALPAESLGP
jgi:hypothetical protein